MDLHRPTSRPTSHSNQPSATKSTHLTLHMRTVSGPQLVVQERRVALISINRRSSNKSNEFHPLKPMVAPKLKNKSTESTLDLKSPPLLRDAICLGRTSQSLTTVAQASRFLIPYSPPQAVLSSSQLLRTTPTLLLQLAGIKLDR